MFVPYEVHVLRLVLVPLNVFFVKVKWIFEFVAFLAEILMNDSGSSCYMMISLCKIDAMQMTCTVLMNDSVVVILYFGFTNFL